ncbi:MAG: hypothetical protein IKP95_03315 [Ruminococcus sp.]|nr:hypothetical protein [Ruminococcus sp.]
MKEHRALKTALAALAAAVLAGTSVLPAFADDNNVLGDGEHLTPDDGHYQTDTDFPASFDLRNVDGENYVTPVRFQGGWGTCWCFAATAACEISAIYELETTQNIKVDVDNVDFSELQTAWFSSQPLPEGNEHYPAQAGEGGAFLSLFEDDGQYNLATGGSSFTAGSLYSMGVGPITEKMVPYKNHSGNTVKNADGDPWYYSADNEDWSVDEEYRFITGLEFEDCNLLPSPSLWKTDEDGSDYYVYNEDATKVIKSELMNGRGVTIGFHADVGSKVPQPYEVSKYLSENFAHYTYDMLQANHAVCIVGWDDNYSADNFRQGVDDQGNSIAPPADGAWIVKNSWGSTSNEFPNKNNWGYEGSGYFYLSYYDRSLDGPESFNFYTDNYLTEREFLSIDQHDLMPTSGINGIKYNVPVVMANVFDVECDEVLRAVSTETCQPNTTVSYEIYRLNKDHKSPIDGESVASFEDVYQYPGYHRTDLPEGVELKKGDCYAILVCQQVEDGYIVEIKRGSNRKAVEEDLKNEPEYIEMMKSFGAKALSYSVGVINRGESFVCVFEDDNEDLEWTDWVDQVELYKATAFAENGEYLSFDNLPIKGYADPILDDEDDPETPAETPDSKPETPDSKPETPDTNPDTGAHPAVFALVVLAAGAALAVKKRAR